MVSFLSALLFVLGVVVPSLAVKETKRVLIVYSQEKGTRDRGSVRPSGRIGSSRSSSTQAVENPGSQVLSTQSVPGRWRWIVRGPRSSVSPVPWDLVSLCVHALYICIVISPLSLVVGARCISGTRGAPKEQPAACANCCSGAHIP